MIIVAAGAAATVCLGVWTLDQAREEWTERTRAKEDAAADVRLQRTRTAVRTAIDEQQLKAQATEAGVPEERLEELVKELEGAAAEGLADELVGALNKAGRVLGAAGQLQSG